MRGPLTQFVILKWYYDQKIIFFLPILKAYSLNIQLAKFGALCFIRRLFILSVSFGFQGPPLLTFKTDRYDIREMDLEKMTSSTH